MYFDKLNDAKRYAKAEAGIWSGSWWAVSDTRLKGTDKSMTVADGMGKPSKPKKETPTVSTSRPMPSPYRPQAVRWHQ